MDVWKIPFDSVDLSDERFRISYHFSRERLRDSLAKAGLLQPLLLVERAGRLVLLSGWKRILIIKDIGVGEGPAGVLDEDDDLAAFRRAFYENASFRDFSVVEKATIVRRFLELGEEEETILSSLLPFFRLPPAQATLDMLETLAGDDPETRRLLHEGDVPPAAAAILSAMSPAARKRVAGILVPLGRNKQLQLLEDLADLSVRDDQSIEEVLQSEDIRTALADESLAAVVKSERLRESLNRRKNPLLWAWKESFDRSVRRLGLPRKASVRADPAFESDELTFTLSFSSAEEFRAAIVELEKLSRRKEVEALFRVSGDPTE